jgi:hypothetical protein
MQCLETPCNKEIFSGDNMEDQNNNPTRNIKICGARTRSGASCKTPPMTNGRCKMHGGKTPKGVDNKNFKTGSYSKYIKIPNLKKIYDSLVAANVDPYDADPDMLLLLARQRQLLQSGDNRDNWAEISKLWPVLRAGLAKNASEAEKEAAMATIPKLDALIISGKAQNDKMNEMYRVTEQIDRMRTRAVKRDIDTASLINPKLAIALFAQVLFVLQEVIIEYAVARKVADAGIIQRVQEAWQRMMDRTDVDDPEPFGEETKLLERVDEE